MFYNNHNYIRDKYYQELKDLPIPIRESMVFKYYTEEIPVYFKEGDLFAGWYGYEEEPQWTAEKNHTFPYETVMDEEERKLLRHLRDELKTIIGFSSAHTCIDYGTVLQKGLIYYIDRVEKELQKYPEDTFLAAMKNSLKAAAAFPMRYAQMVREKAEASKDVAAVERFAVLYEALCNVPLNPARNFLEAVQCIWLMHSLIPMAEMSWASISIGRMDQYLYPYYQKAKAEGMSEGEMKDILKQLFVLLDNYGDGACALNIGGMDSDGNDMMNELSELLIETEKEMCLRAPILTVRVSRNTPGSILDSLIDINLFRIGQPTFYGETACRKAVMERGVKEEEAVDFTLNSCMGLYLSGKEFANMWAVKLNMHMALEMAVNSGKPFHSETGFTLKTVPKEITNIQELLEQYGAYLDELIGVSASLYRKVADETAKNVPDPLLSAITEGCVEKRGDRATCALYNTMTVETMGLINTCDAIEAIRELVFEQEKYSLKELVDAAKNNYEGYQNVLQDIRNCKKYGMNDEDTNRIAGRLVEYAAASCKRYSSGNMIYAPSLHTIDVNVWYGAELYATLDGRKAGEPVNKNANPSALLQKLDHTSHVLSAAALNQPLLHGGQPIDLYFDKSWFETKEQRDKIKALIMTYFDLDGLQFQVNSVDVDLLEKAHRAPEEYPQVIVRKGGYSVRFNEMGKREREDFINRSKAERG